MGEALLWYHWLPVVLAALYGAMEYRTVYALGYPAAKARFKGLISFVTVGANALLWSMLGFPLPIFYVVDYGFRLLRFGFDREPGYKKWFLLNLGFINIMVLHLIVISLTALFQGVAMQTLLADGFWRGFTVALTMALNIGEGVVFLRRQDMSQALAGEAEGVEARPFMAFLWFCTLYLLTDSLLCAACLGPLYPPLFLLGSSVIVIFMLLRFLWHINAIIRNHHLQEEHDRLALLLQQTKQKNSMLQQLAEKDALTAVCSRRFILEQLTALQQSAAEFAVVYMDLDGLKRINDQLGHNAGDDYLLRFVAALCALMREEDLLGRLGGDEFLLLMPGCARATAVKRLEAIRREIEALPDEPVIRFSFGASAQSAAESRTVEELLAEADQQMYLDKQKRR